MRTAPVVFAFAALAAACGSERTDEARRPGPLAAAFSSSADGAGVPRDLLVAIAQVEGGLDMPAVRDVAPDAHVPVAGPLQLRHGHFDSLARGAALVATSEEGLRRDTDLALVAGARVLAELGARTDARPADLASWGPAIEELSGYFDAPHRAHYAHRVFAVLARGGTFEGRDGEPIVLPPHPELPPSLTLEISLGLKPLSGSDYGAAEWIPTPQTNKWASGRDGNAVTFIVVHDTEGGWDASVATLQNDPGKSAHYIVGEGGRVGQFVHEADTAWHCGNSIYNKRSVGIEHVGYAKKPFPAPLYAASARLVDALATKYVIPRDRAHVIGHDQVPNGSRIDATSPPCAESPATCQANTSYGGASHHTDPGVWEWCTFMARLGGQCKCNDAPATWRCSTSGSEAFRCAPGGVELAACDGPGACEAAPDGGEAVCHRAPTKPPPPSDAGAPVSDAAPAVSDGASPPTAPVAASGGAAEGGCAAAPASRGGDGPRAGLWLAAIALSALAVRRRRRAPA